MITFKKTINLVEVSNSKRYMKFRKIFCWNESWAEATNICFKKISF